MIEVRSTVLGDHMVGWLVVVCVRCVTGWFFAWLYIIYLSSNSATLYFEVFVAYRYITQCIHHLFFRIGSVRSDESARVSLNDGKKGLLSAS